MKNVLFFFLSAISQMALSQTGDLYKADSIPAGLHRANVGKVTFMNGNIPLAQYHEDDFLNSYEFSRKSDLNIRVFMDNSVANYLHQLAPELPPEKLLQSGNLQFTFYVDGVFIYRENIHHGCSFGSGGSKKTSTTFRVPLTSTKGEDWWAMYMWDRFMENGGSHAMDGGRHILKLEIRPYVGQADQVRVGDLIASGEIELAMKRPVVTEADLQVQPIAPGSGWEISNMPYDIPALQQLNKSIALDELKDITSIIVVHDGKLMIEEYFNGAARDTLHDTRSAGKSFTSTLLGLAISDGFIKDEYSKLKAFYDLKKFRNYSAIKADIKLKDLLTMSSAFDGSDSDNDSPGNEENMYPTDDWVKFALDLPVHHGWKNGKQWNYFTAGVVLLGDILDKNVRGGLEKYAGEKLFQPLGITKYRWQYTPQKVVNTAGSLQMRSLDYAKYAQLYKNKGVWNEQRILTAKWVDKTLSRHIQIPNRGDQYYGYLFWNKTYNFQGKKYEVYYCAGNGGNQFLIFKNLPLVIVITSKAYNKPYAHAQADKIVTNYLLPAILDARD